MHCRWCEKEARFQARDEDEAYGMLDEWRLSMKGRQSKNRNWSCPSCRTWWDEEPTTTETAETAATDAAGSAGRETADQRMQRASFDALQLEVVALKAEVVELKAEVERLKAEVVELKYEDNVMREIAEETGRCGESLLVYSVDVPSPCVPVSVMRDIAENMEQDSIRLRTLSSRLHQLLRQRSSASSGEVSTE